MRKLCLKPLLFGANLFFVEDFYNSDISQSPFPHFPSSDGWEGGGKDSLHFIRIKPFVQHIFTALYIKFQELQFFFFCLPKGYTAIILYTFCNRDHNFQYLINIEAAMARKALGCDRATRPELFKQRTPPQSKKCFYKNLAEVSDMPRSWGRVYNVQESFREQLLDTVILPSYEGEAEHCALGGLELAHPMHTPQQKSTEESWSTQIIAEGPPPDMYNTGKTP